MNNNIFNASEDNWFIKQNPKYKPVFPIATVKEPVATNLPFLKTETPEITNYSSKGGEKKSSGDGVLGENFFGITLSPELTKIFEEAAKNKNSTVVQENFDKNSNMWYYKPENNSSKAGVGSLVSDVPTSGLQNIGSVPKASEKSSGEKEGSSKRRSDFFEDLDLNNLPTEEQMDFADAAFGNQPGFLEDNNVLRNITRYVRSGGKQSKYGLDGAKLVEAENTADAESKRQAARRTYEEKYRAELAKKESKERNVAQEEHSKTSASSVDPEVESKRQAARRTYEEKYRAEVAGAKENTKEHISYSDILFPNLRKYTSEYDQYAKEFAKAKKEEHERQLNGLFEYYYSIFSEEDREKIRNGEGIASFLDGLNPEETDQFYNKMQEVFKSASPEVQKEFGFYAEDIFAGVPLNIRRKIFSKLKTGKEVTYDDLVAYGLYDGEEKFFEKWAAKDFASLTNAAYNAYERDTSLDELSFEYNAQQAAQAQALFMEVLMGRVNGNPIELVPNSKKEHRPKIVEPASEKIVKNTPTDVLDDLPDEVPTANSKNKQPQQFIDGKEFEKQFGKDLAEANVDVLEQPQIYNEDGSYTQPDFFFKTKDGRKGIIDAKLSSSTKLSKGQKKFFDTFDKLKLRLRGKRTQQFNGSEFLGPVDTYIVFDISKMEEGFFEKNNLEPIDLNEFLPGFTKGDKYGFYKYK